MQLYLKAESPVPNDLGLAIPGNLPMFEVLIVVAFILHLIYVNITVGGAVYAVLLEIVGIRKRDDIADKLALQLATMVAIHKSIAVVLGVAPLLVISTIYTQFFYPSTIMIGKWWLMLIPLLIVSFLLLYVYKFTWHRWQNRKKLHLVFGISGTAILLFVPLLFITNVASMLQPELWNGSKGFFDSLFRYPTIWQRYLHFMAAGFAVIGMYMYWWGKRKSRQEDNPVYALARKFGKGSALLFTLLQLIAGPLLLLSMNSGVRSSFLGGSLFHTSLLGTAVALAFVLVALMYKLYKADSRKLFVSSLTVLLLIMGLMSWIRHEVRELYLAPYTEEVSRTLRK
ncbi:cytochrome ubiquinol oxidase subunit I [Cohnella sp. LGH]|uniref:cytochrome ubiquinol oxidase subunit I n=1 Tax=Cohnella sp. LGH TaxID=1619153 RepID=UPI001ADBD214|nr:cytochrome ubiquinol oxidase subunit I [Cohnella sp. LGH]QTH45475.1 cytochrome ubiquinol oxidase subunit I [Cohnella sp. LGH]